MGTLVLCSAAKVEADYFGSHLLKGDRGWGSEGDLKETPKGVLRQALIEGLAQVRRGA